MIYVGMDVSSKSFAVHVINEKKKVLFKGTIAATREGLAKLMKRLGTESKLVVFEAGNQLKWIALWFKRRPGVHLHVVHPNEVKWISQSGGKTDKVDAKKLAELGRGDLLPREVHIVEGRIRELRELISARQTLLSKRVALCNSIRAMALQEGRKLPDKFFHRPDWEATLEKKRLSATLAYVVKSFRESIDALKASEQELMDRIAAIEHERLVLLESIPSVGTLTSRVLLSAIDEAGRFDNRKAAAKYGALTPTIYQSGAFTHLGHINRNGRQEVRRVLLQCAHTVVRMKSVAATPLKDFYQRVMARRGKKIAIVAVARKLLVVSYAVLKHRAAYDPAKLQSTRAQGGRTYRLAAAVR